MLTINEKVKSNFESSAEKFDRIYNPSEEKSVLSRLLDKWFRKTMFFRFEETLKNIDSEKIQSILDVGCGSGYYARRMAQRVAPGGTVFCVKISSPKGFRSCVNGFVKKVLPMSKQFLGRRQTPNFRPVRSTGSSLLMSTMRCLIQSRC